MLARAVVADREETLLEAGAENVAFKTYLGFWLARPTADQTVNELTAAINRGDWNGLRLAAGEGDLIVTSETGEKVYELRAVARALARWMKTTPARPTLECSAELAGRSLRGNITVDMPSGNRYETSMKGRVTGPAGRFFNVHIDAGVESPVHQMLSALRVRPRG